MSWPLPQPLCPSHDVSQALAGVILVVSHGDHGDTRPARVFTQEVVSLAVGSELVLQDPDTQTSSVASHDYRGILYSFSGGGRGL